MSTSYLGIKLGSTTTYIYKPGNGIVLREASLVAMSSNLKYKDVKAIGNDAKRMIGKTSDGTRIYSPIVNGVVEYEEYATNMLKGFLKKIYPTKKLGHNIKAVLCTPLGITPAEKKSLEIVCFKAGIADVFLVPDIICYALGNGIDIKSETSQLIVNIGGDTTNIAIISNYTIIKGYNFAIGGELINIAIAKYIEETYNLLVSLEQVDRLKLEICSLFENYSATMEIMGINKISQTKEKILITATELYPIVNYYYSKIADAINSIIQESDPNIIEDISNNGIYFYGGATQIVGLERFMSKYTDFKIHFSNISKSNIVGTGELIKYPQLLKRIIKNN